MHTPLAHAIWYMAPQGSHLADSALHLTLVPLMEVGHVLPEQHGPQAHAAHGVHCPPEQT